MVVMMDLDQNLFPSTASFGVSSVPIDNINIDVGVVISDYHCHLRGEDCNGSTIGMYHEQKTSA